MDITQHSIQSSYREAVREHLFVGKVMRYCWQHQLVRIEMLTSQVDHSGYDVVLEANGIMRHIQLKASYVGASTAGVSINTELASSPVSRWAAKTGMHTKTNAQGIKTQRANIRYVTKAAFTRMETIKDVARALFGDALYQNLEGIAVKEV